MNLVMMGLGVVLLMVLVLPFSVKHVEEQLEAFLFAMGALAVTISGGWSGHLVAEAFKEPVMISAAVLVAGFIFGAVRHRLQGWMDSGKRRFGQRLLVILVVAGLGLLSSMITAIIAALILSEAVTALKLSRRVEIKIVILACFSIGLGAVLTPIGEPLSTIAVARLRGEPHNADFWFLARLLGGWIVPMVLGLGIWAGMLDGEDKESSKGLSEDKAEGTKDVVARALKVYVFVMALVLLGHGFTPIVDTYLVRVPGWALYWINMVSAVLDNATLAAAEISPQMDLERIKDILLGLLISGGMLIPGNIPNIICASKLGIKSKEWAAFGAPVGLGLMAGAFVILMVF